MMSNKAFHHYGAHSAPRVNADVLLYRQDEYIWRYREDDRYTMKASVYSPFSTLWKNIPRVFHGMENQGGTPPNARSLIPSYERQTPHKAL